MRVVLVVARALVFASAIVIATISNDLAIDYHLRRHCLSVLAAPSHPAPSRNSLIDAIEKIN